MAKTPELPKTTNVPLPPRQNGPESYGPPGVRNPIFGDQLHMDVGVARTDHHPIVAVEQQIAVETVGPGFHREEEAEQHRAVGDRCR